MCVCGTKRGVCGSREGGYCTCATECLPVWMCTYLCVPVCAFKWEWQLVKLAEADLYWWCVWCCYNDPYYWFSPFHHYLLTQASTSANILTTDQETSGTQSLENAVTVLSTEFENDELWEYKPTQMCKLWPQWLYSLQLSLRSVAKESYHAFMLHSCIIGSTAAKLA